MRTVKTKDIREALAVAALFGATHSPIEHFLSCRVKTTATGVTLLCGSSFGFCQTSVCSDGDDAFSAYVPIRRLKDALSNIKDENISIGVKDASLAIVIAAGEVLIASSSYTLDLPGINEGEWVDIDSKASSSELAFLSSISTMPINDCIKIQGSQSTTCTNTAFSWVNNSVLRWAEGCLLSMQAANLLHSLLLKAEAVSVLLSDGNLGVKWSGGVALVRGLEFAGKVRTVPAQFFSAAPVPICEVQRQELQRIVGLCQGISLVESIGVHVDVENGQVRVKKHTKETGSVDMGLQCIQFAKDYSWHVDVNALLLAVRSISADTVSLSGVITHKDDPEALTLAIGDGTRFIAIGSLQQ